MPAVFWKGLFYIAGIALAVAILVQIWTVLIPFLLGLTIAYLVQPLLTRFEARGYRRDRIVLVLYAAMLSATVALAVVLVPTMVREMQQAAREIPRYTAAFDEMISRFNNDVIAALERTLGPRAAVFRLNLRAERLLDELIFAAPHNLLNVAHFALWAIIVPFVAFFAMAQGRRWMNLIFDHTPPKYVESLLGLVAEIDSTLGGFMRGQLLEAACVGTVTMAGLALLGFDGAVLFGLVTAAMNLVPMMAPIVGGALALLIGYLQGMPVASLVGIFFVFLVVRLLDDFLFIPFVLGHSVRLHPVVIVFAVLSGFELGGFFGLVVAVPVAAVLKVVLGVLFGERRMLPSLDERHIVA